ncbi:MAG: DUF58 domain-containing protein [Caulobacter sp.]|nr:DUF58 domain-containing protein [Caulobacter sp.]
MIYPTRTGVALAAAGAPIALVAGVFASRWWVAGVAWSGLIVVLMVLDVALNRLRRAPQITMQAPGVLAVGETVEVELAVAFRSIFTPRRVELMLEGDANLEIAPRKVIATVADKETAAAIALTPHRRGEAILSKLWVRWSGPLRLAWTQIIHPLDHAAPVTPNIGAVKDEALRLFSRDALHGLKAQIETGEGTEFHALRDFLPGMDHRTIDWKQSARHGKLVSQERRTERNHTIVLALDTGRTMCEPVAGAPRIDRAINAALLISYVSLANGDRVGVFGFDSRPRLSTGATSGVQSFPLIQRLVSRLDYTTEETNFTLGLTTLAGDLDRRSLVIIFTEFTDSIGAELMLDNLKRLLKRHLVLFVVLRDEELESLARREPVDGADIARAVTAAALMKEREIVMVRLRRLGVQLVEAPADAVGPTVVNAYLDIKRRNLL